MPGRSRQHRHRDAIALPVAFAGVVAVVVEAAVVEWARGAGAVRNRWRWDAGCSSRAVGHNDCDVETLGGDGWTNGIGWVRGAVVGKLVAVVLKVSMVFEAVGR